MGAGGFEGEGGGQREARCKMLQHTENLYKQKTAWASSVNLRAKHCQKETISMQNNCYTSFSFFSCHMFIVCTYDAVLLSLRDCKF